MEYKDYYATLGVSKKVDASDLQKAYRKLARKYHPDVNKTAEAEAKFKEINEAYEVLKDPEKRAKYDRFGSAWKQAQRTGTPPPGFEDIFSIFTSGGRGGAGGFEFRGEGPSSFFDMLFGGSGGTGPHIRWTSSGPAGFAQSGADHDAKITLPLEEAARGGRRELSITDPVTGERRTLRVRIPPGIRPGQRIRLSGQGGQGSGGGARGDLYLTVDIRPHPDFRLDGGDLHTTLPVSPWEAALGGKAEVATLDGPVTVKVPPGSSSGRKIRLRERGFPDSNGKRGDLYAEIKILIPESLTDRERDLFTSLAEESRFKPRGGRA